MPAPTPGYGPSLRQDRQHRPAAAALVNADLCSRARTANPTLRTDVTMRGMSCSV